MVLQQEQPDDYVIATGVQYSVREFIEKSAKRLGMVLEWRGSELSEEGWDINTGRRIVAIDPRYFRPTEVETLLGDATHAREKLGWVPKISFDELVRQMVDEDLSKAERDKLVSKHGYPILQHHE